MIHNSAVSRLRVYDPTHAAPASKNPNEPSTRWTLTQLYERAFVPLWIRPKGLKPKTEVIYLDALKHWCEITGDPAIANITDYTTANFTSELLKKPGRKNDTMSIASVRKHCKQIDKLLAFTGPRTRDSKGRKNLGLLDFPPIVDSPSADTQPPAGDFTLAEIQTMYGAAEHAPATTCLVDVDAAKWWRALISVALYTGLRIGELMRLRFEDLLDCHITVWAKTAKGRKGKRQYLHPEALQEIESIRGPRELIFEWRNWEKNPRWLQTCFKRLLARAGIPESRQFGFHGLRKAHATLIADQGEANGISTAQLSLGHASEGVTKGHYVSGSVQEKIVAQAIQKLPSPKPKRASADDARQRDLF